MTYIGPTSVKATDWLWTPSGLFLSITSGSIAARTQNLIRGRCIVWVLRLDDKAVGGTAIYHQQQEGGEFKQSFGGLRL